MNFSRRMPQLLHLQHGDELPFFVRTNRSAGRCVSRRLSRMFNVRTLITAVVAFVVAGFMYIQFFSVQGELNQVSNIDASLLAKRPRHLTAMTLTTHNYNAKMIGENSADQVIAQPKFPNFDGSINERQRAVRKSFIRAWLAYRTHAWGHDQLRPLSRSFQEWMECGLTIVDSLDTIIIMGLKSEFEDAKHWIDTELTFDRNRFVNLFETTIRVLGGLLSAFVLTGEDVFLRKAIDLGDRLIGAFHSESPVPYSDVNLYTKNGKQPSWSGDSSLSEVTSIQLEFRTLSRLTGNDTYEKLAFQTSKHIHTIGCGEYDGLCGMFLSPKTGKFTRGTTITFGARSDSYYEYLLKQWLQLGKSVDWLVGDYTAAVDSMEKLLWRQSDPNKFGFVGELLGGKTYSPKMDHLACFMAGTLALGVANGLPDHHMTLARNLSLTCHEFYNTATGLAPEIAYFNMLPGVKDDLTIKPLDTHCLLRPEAFESWFYMYRITGDRQYQEWGWRAFQAIDQHARPPNGVGYASVNNVKKMPVTHRDLMESFFLSESLKYLYLLLADDQTMLPLNKYVFNTEGHPLPIYSS